MVHSQNKYNGEHLGENIYWCSGMEIDRADMTTSFYDEIHDSSLNKPGFKSEQSILHKSYGKTQNKLELVMLNLKMGHILVLQIIFLVENINTSEYFRENVQKKS